MIKFAARADLHHPGRFWLEGSSVHDPLPHTPSAVNSHHGAMSLDGNIERRDDLPAGNGNSNGMSMPVMAPVPLATLRPSYGFRGLRLNPNKVHKPDSYEDVQSKFDPSIFSSLEHHLPPSMLEAPRHSELEFMREILARYLPEGERARGF